MKTLSNRTPNFNKYQYLPERTVQFPILIRKQWVCFSNYTMIIHNNINVYSTNNTVNYNIQWGRLLSVGLRILLDELQRRFPWLTITYSYSMASFTLSDFCDFWRSDEYRSNICRSSLAFSLSDQSLACRVLIVDQAYCECIAMNPKRKLAMWCLQ